MDIKNGCEQQNPDEKVEFILDDLQSVDDTDEVDDFICESSTLAQIGGSSLKNGINNGSNHSIKSATHLENNILPPKRCSRY